MERSLCSTEEDETARGETEHGNDANDGATDASTVNVRLYAIRHIPGKGQGLFASFKILKGTRILSEAQIFKAPRHATDLKAVEGVIIEALKSLSKEQQRACLSLHNKHGSNLSPFLGIAKINLLPLGTEA